MRIFKVDSVAGLAAFLFVGCAPGEQKGDFIRGEMQEHHVPGMACLVLKDDEPVKTFYGGEANLEWNTPVAADTVFEIGSVSKQFAAASILLLAEQGKLSVDDPISKYLTNTPTAWAK